MRTSTFILVACSAVVLSLSPGPSRAVPLVMPGGVVMDVRLQPVVREADEPVEELGWFDYLKASLTLEDFETAEQVEDNKVPAWILGALFNGYGGHIWAPMIFYKDAPTGPARSAAMWLGGIGVALNYALICFLPFFYIPFLGWAVVAVGWGCILAMNWFFIPRAITHAYSDAYRYGSDEPAAPKKKKAKKKRRYEDDEE